MIDKILERALSLVNQHIKDPPQGLIIVVDGGLEATTWLIQSLTGGEHSVVGHSNDNGWECSCRYWKFKGECKHIKCMKIIQERGIYVPIREIEENNGI